MGERRRVAAIGLGRMGGPMVDHVIAAGHDVCVVDVDRAAVAPRVAAGATAADTPAEAARDADAVLVVVLDDQQVFDVLTGPDGALSAAPSGCVVCVHTTAELATIESVAERGATRGVVVLDAGVTGGEPGAQAGTLITMVGGSQAAVDRIRPLLDTFSREVVHAGPLGAGMSLKLARNAAGYVMMAAVHEAMTLAKAAGVDLEVLQHVLTESAVAAQGFAPFQLGGPDPVDGDAPEPLRDMLAHTYRLGAKDLSQAQALAARLGVEVPAVEATRSSLRRIMRLEGRERTVGVRGRTAGW